MIGVRNEWLGTPRVRLALAAAMVAAGMVPVLSREASWLGSWKMALDWGTFSITLLGPVAAGTACAVYVRNRRAQLPELLSQAARPWLGWVAPALVVWLLAAVGVVLICAATTTATWAAGANAYPSVSWVVLPALVVLAADVAVGALIGSVVGHPFAAPWAAVTTFTLFILTSTSVIPGVFRTGGVSGSLAGGTFVTRTLVLQAVAALGFAAGAMALSHVDLFRDSSLLTRVVTAVTIVGTAVALFGLNGDHERYALVADPEYECREGPPAVCMLAETTRPLDDIAGRMQRLSEHLTVAGASLPDRWLQVMGTPHPADGAINVPSDYVLDDQVSDADAAEALSTPADCPAYSSDDPTVPLEATFAIRRILTRWILVQAAQEPAPSDGPLAAWWALPPEEQHPWVRTTYDALRDCRLGDLRPPRSAPPAP